MTFPIFIPSKGRHNFKLGQLLQEEGIPYAVFVEPQDELKYQTFHYGKIIVLKENNKGLPYARNAILNYAKEKGIEWFWMLDDDITNFYHVIEGKCLKSNAQRVLEGAQAYFSKALDVAQVSLDYQQFAWASKAMYSFNSFCDVAVCINAKAILHKYDSSVELKEDRDFSMQVIKSGYCTMRIHNYAFSCPKNGSNKGGLYNLYKEGREFEACNRMVRKWGSEVCKIVQKKNGRIDLKIYWKNINKGSE